MYGPTSLTNILKLSKSEWFQKGKAFKIGMFRHREDNFNILLEYFSQVRPEICQFVWSDQSDRANGKLLCTTTFIKLDTVHDSS